MDRNRDGGQGCMVRKWRALTSLVEWKVLTLTLNLRAPTANLIRSLGGGASTCRAAPGPQHPVPGRPNEGSLAMGSSSDGATSVRRSAIPTAKRPLLSGPRSLSTCNYLCLVRWYFASPSVGIIASQYADGARVKPYVGEPPPRPGLPRDARRRRTAHRDTRPCTRSQQSQQRQQSVSTPHASLESQSHPAHTRGGGLSKRLRRGAVTRPRTVDCLTEAAVEKLFSQCTHPVVEVGIGVASFLDAHCLTARSIPPASSDRFHLQLPRHAGQPYEAAAACRPPVVRSSAR